MTANLWQGIVASLFLCVLAAAGILSVELGDARAELQIVIEQQHEERVSTEKHFGDIDRRLEPMAADIGATRKGCK